MDEVVSLQSLVSPREAYEIHFNNLVSQLAGNFTHTETEKLCFIFHKLFPATFREQNGQNALKLLEHLMIKSVFSSEKPLKLAKLMEVLDFRDKKDDVEKFIEKFKSMIPVQQRLLPPTPSTTNPIQEEIDDSYVTLHQANWTSSTTSIVSSTNSKMPIQCDSSSMHSEEQAVSEEGYVVLHPSPTHALHRARRESFPSSSDRSSTTDDDDEIYAQPYAEVALQAFGSHNTYPLLQERMKLLRNPLRDIVANGCHQILTSPRFHCHFPRSTFQLEINPLDGHYLSAKLYLEPGSEMESGSLSSKYYLVELQVNQSRKKSQGKTAQNIYAHSSLMRKPTSDHHSLLITSEANSGTPDSPTPSSSPQTQRKDSGKVCVASFPSIISHDVIMDEGLLTKNYLIVSFALRHYQQPT